MTVTLQEGRDKVGAVTGEANPPTGSAGAHHDRPEVLNFERSEVLHFLRELLDFLREFSEARPRSRPTSPLAHRARNTSYRAVARSSAPPDPYLPPLARHVEEGQSVRAAVHGRAVVVPEGPATGTAARAPEVLGAPGTAGELFRRPRSLAGSMPRPEELLLGTEVHETVPQEEASPFVEHEPPEVLAAAPPGERRGWRRLRVPPFVSRM
ncbi:MAG TPA: hypothetical protein VK425_07340 [Acidimicrobiales bacterium]|nr:hypothetical protein [Acidimicrobiales bacterium]